MATNPIPTEVMSSPFDLFYGTADVAAPVLSVDPDGSDWTLIGSNGQLNYDREPGLEIALPRSVNSWRSHGDLGTRKRFPTEADLMVKIRLVDMTLEQFAHVVNLNTITTPVAGSVGVEGTGEKEIGLSLSFSLTTVALLIRFGMSPYVVNGKSQFYLPRVQNIAATTLKNAQGVPMGFDLEFAALVKPDETEQYRFGRFRAQFTPEA